MKRVLVLIKGLGIGGAEKLISEGARYWDRDRFDYSVAYVLPWKDQLVGDLQSRGIPVECIGSARGLTPATLTRLRSKIRRENVDLVHAHLPTMGVVARLVSPVPVVYTEHNMASSYREATRWLNRRTYGRNREVIAVSDAVAGSVAGWPGPTVRVIPNGVSAEVDPRGASKARAELGIDDEAPLVAHVGNIRPGKGHNTLIEAAGILRETRRGVSVVSVGGEKYPGDLERVRSNAHSAGLDDIHFLGRRPDALDFVAAANVFVNPSDVEGLPVAVLEAMALSKPVVATAVGGVPSVIRDGETGLLVEPGDAAGIATAIEKLLDNPAMARQLGDAARALVEDEYGLATMVRRTEAVYDEVLR